MTRKKLLTTALASLSLPMLLAGCLQKGMHHGKPFSLVPVARSNCTIELDTGTCYTVDIDGTPRYFYIIEPASMDPSKGMLLVTHGSGDQIDWQNEYFGASRVAESTGKLLVMPRGTALKGPLNTGNQIWNATTACCFFDKVLGTKPPDDEKLLKTIIDEVNKNYHLNTAAVTLWGYSNGAFLANSFACNHSAAISQVISVSGTIRLEANECKPENTVPAMHIHGDHNPLIAFAGDTTDKDASNTDYRGIAGVYSAGLFPGAEEVTDRWLNVNACDTTSATTSIISGLTINDGVRYDTPEKIIRPVPNPELVASRNATLTQWNSCKNGATVQRVIINGGTHKNIYDLDKLDALVVDFIQKQGERKESPTADIPDAPQYDRFNTNGKLNDDDSIALASFSVAGMHGIAFVRNNGDQSYFARVSFAGNDDNPVETLALLDQNQGTLASDTAPYRSKRYGYASFSHVTTTPTAIAITVNGQQTTASLSFGSGSPVYEATLKDGGNVTQATLELQVISPSRLNYTVTLADPANRSKVSEIRADSLTQPLALYPVPTGLPNPYNYVGQYSDSTFYSAADQSYFHFDNSGVVSGFADVGSIKPYVHEHLVSTPEDFEARITIDGQTYKALLSPKP